MSKIYRIPVLALNNPTDPASYVDRHFATGTPLNWQDDMTGRTNEAVMAYLDQSATEPQLKIVIAYIQHHIHAPMWLESSPFTDDMDDDIAAEIRALRALSLELKTNDDIHQYISRALDIGLDPF